MIFKNKQNAAFTLAEILVTLAIIGVVAALTITHFINDYQKKVTAVKLEQTYALMTEAIKLVSLDFDGNGMNSWKCDDYPYGNYWGTRCFGLIFDKMKLTKRFPVAGSKDKAMCYEEGKSYKPYTYPSGGLISSNARTFCPNSYSVSLANGACVAYSPFYWCAEAGGGVVIDVDGPAKGQNRLGKDTFFFIYGEGNDQVNPVRGRGLSIRPGGYGIDAEGNIIIPTTRRLTDWLLGCVKGSWDGAKNCTGLIVKEGWKITKNYPWDKL